jgi:MAF protein
MQNGEIVIAADTTVIHDGEILGKPGDADKAAEMLDTLRGNTHEVITSLAIIRTHDGLELSDQAVTEVPMREYSQEEVHNYIASGDPLDKAGSYAIQHEGFHPVTNMQGCYANVVGLPLCHVVRTLEKFDISLLEDVPEKCQRHFDYDCKVYEHILKGEL